MLETLRTLQRTRAHPLRAPRGAPRPGAARLRRRAPARVAWRPRVRAPHPARGHLLRGVEKVPEGATYCALCSRLRRGVLYNAAHVAGLHEDRAGAPPRRRHRDAAAQPALRGQDRGDAGAAGRTTGAHVVIRPMIYCAEETLAAYAAARLPHPPVQPLRLAETAQRKQVKALLNALEAEHPGVKGRCSRRWATCARRSSSTARWRRSPKTSRSPRAARASATGGCACSEE
jgi:hypothetical protein